MTALHKYLGVVLDDNLRWNKNTNQLVNVDYIFKQTAVFSGEQNNVDNVLFLFNVCFYELI